MLGRGRTSPEVLRRIWEFLVGRLLLSVVALGILFGVAFVLRQPLLRTIGGFLIVEDPRTKCDALYVLGGAPVERGEQGAQLLMEGIAPVVYCTGSQVPLVLEPLGLLNTEADLSRRAGIAFGADSTRIQAYNVGTSTFEEAEAIVAHAKKLGYSDMAVVSTEFHLRRVRRVFRKRARGTPVRVHVYGAGSKVYDSQRWWESEEGLLMVNNEYVKLLYYWLRY
jgi:uncharacterized SAM-binding protein YcdF (DUF218 family)